jgi:hypothetical protein
MNSNIRATAEAIFNDQHSISNSELSNSEFIKLIEKRLIVLYEDAKKIGKIQVINHLSGELDRCNPER